MPRRYRSAAVAIGLAGMVSDLFWFGTGAAVNFVPVHGPALIVLPAVGLLAIISGLFGRRSIVILAGIAYGAAAIVQVTQLGLNTNVLQGNASTFALFLAGAIGLIVLGSAGSAGPDPLHTPDPSRPEEPGLGDDRAPP